MIGHIDAAEIDHLARAHGKTKRERSLVDLFDRSALFKEMERLKCSRQQNPVDEKAVAIFDDQGDFSKLFCKVEGFGKDFGRGFGPLMISTKGMTGAGIKEVHADEPLRMLHLTAEIVYPER